MYLFYFCFKLLIVGFVFTLLKQLKLGDKFPIFIETLNKWFILKMASVHSYYEEKLIKINIHIKSYS